MVARDIIAPNPFAIVPVIAADREALYGGLISAAHPIAYARRMADTLPDSDGSLQMLARYRLATASSELERLMHIVDRNRYTAAACVNAVEFVLHTRRWLREAGRGSYAYDDERYQQEFGLAFDEIMEALRPMRAVAQDKTDCTTDPEKVQAARAAGADRFAALSPQGGRITQAAVDAALDAEWFTDAGGDVPAVGQSYSIREAMEEFGANLSTREIENAMHTAVAAALNPPGGNEWAVSYDREGPR